MKYLFSIIVLSLLLGCKKSFDVSYVESKTWSYNNGFKVGKGDFIIFDKSKIFKIQGDTIYYKDTPKAIIRNVNKRDFSMELKSLDGKEHSEYRNIEESFK